MKSCDTCIYLSRIDLTCRYEAPRAFPIPVPDTLGRMSIATSTIFPTVKADWWCGRHKETEN